MGVERVDYYSDDEFRQAQQLEIHQAQMAEETKAMEEAHWEKDMFEAEQNDSVNHPAHYCSHPSGIECIQVTEHFSFCIGNSIKYLWRANHKNGIEDLKKAAWYVQREIDRQLKATK